MFKQASIITAAALTCGVFTYSVQAHGDLGGLMPYVNNGKLFTGHYDMHSGSGLVTDTGPTYVYVSEVESNWEGGGTPGIAHPGIVTDGSSPNDPDGQQFYFPANTALTVTANVLPDLGWNLAYWDGSGTVDFAASPHSLTIEDAFNSITLDGGTGTPIGSVSPWISDANGVGHAHLEFILNEPDATASAGVYLYALTFSATGVTPSDPIYYVSGYGLAEPDLDEAIESAEAWVETNLVPEPAALTLAVMAAAGCISRRRLGS